MNQNNQPNNRQYYNQPNPLPNRRPNPNPQPYNQPNPNQQYYNQPNPNQQYYNQPNPNQQYYNQPGYRAAASPELAVPVKENVSMGILGALVGSLAGLAAAFLLSMMNIISALAGVAGVFCAYWCYKKFSGARASKLGIIVSTIFTLIACLLGLYLGLVVQLANEFDCSFSEARELFSYAYDVSSDFRGEVIKNVVLLVLFVGLGCIGTISTAVKQIKAEKAAQQQSPLL